MITNQIDNKTAFNSDVIAGARETNAIKIAGSATIPTIEAVGDDDNVSIKILAKGTGTLAFAGTEGQNGSLSLYADDGDNTADQWTLAALAASATLQISNAATSDAPINLAAGSISVIGTEAGDASLVLDADNGDNAGDTFTITSAAATNTLNILNEASVIATVTTGGLVSAVGGLRSSSATVPIGYAAGAGFAVTQQTNSATTVVSDTPTGQITTVALTTAGAAEEEFTVTCASVAAVDVVALSTTYAGAGLPIAFAKNMAAGSFKIVITNVSASSLNAVMVINYVVLKGQAA